MVLEHLGQIPVGKEAKNVKSRSNVQQKQQNIYKMQRNKTIKLARDAVWRWPRAVRWLWTAQNLQQPGLTWKLVFNSLSAEHAVQRIKLVAVKFK